MFHENSELHNLVSQITQKNGDVEGIVLKLERELLISSKDKEALDKEIKLKDEVIKNLQQQLEVVRRGATMMVETSSPSKTFEGPSIRDILDRMSSSEIRGVIDRSFEDCNSLANSPNDSVLRQNIINEDGLNTLEEVDPTNTVYNFSPSLTNRDSLIPNEKHLFFCF